MVCASAQTKPTLHASEISAAGSDLMIADLDGNGFKDLVVMNDLNLFIFYHETNQVFPRQPQQSYRLEARPCVVWTSKLGKQAESLLVMTSDGVSELCFTNRTGSPIIRQIIQQPTIIPETPEETNVMCCSLSAKTRGNWPLLLLPTIDGLQVWQHRDAWHKAHTIANAVDARLRLSVADFGYTRSLELDFSVGDVNADRQDDLIIRRGYPGRTNIYTLYLQQTNGLFALEPALTYADKVQPFSWLHWADLNHDGKLDLIKSVWLNEPSFIPGVPSSKVLLSTYIADAHRAIPTQPQQVFRKNDWLAALPVADVDGDGFLDMALGFSHMDSKDSLTKEITARQLDYSLRFYFYRPGVGFPKETDFQRDVVIRVDHPEAPFDWVLPQNFVRCVKLSGDFNGDGKTDLLVRDLRDSLSIYFFVSRQKGFTREPALQFNCPETMEESLIADLNNDGISDLIVKLGGQNRFRIFVSQK